MRRTPWLTLGAALVLVAGLVLQYAVAGSLAALERSPAQLHGDWWRWFTPLLVQDGGLVGGVSNLVGVLLAGTAAEQLVSRWTWLVAYLGTGLAGEAVGAAWEPVGGGNSVAVCGLAGLLVVAAVVAPTPEVPLALAAPAYWCGAVGSALWSGLIVVGVVLGVAASGPGQRWAGARWVVVAFCGAVTVGLLATRDLHGGALAVGIVGAGIAAALVPGLFRPR